MTRLKKASDKGFTLLEVLVTMVIAGVLISTVMLTFISGRQNVTRNRNRIIALSHATSTVEFLRNYVTADNAGDKYQKPADWIETGYVLEGLQTSTGKLHNMPIKYEGALSFIGPAKRGDAKTWTRDYNVVDIIEVVNPDNASNKVTITPMKKVTVTVKPQ